MSSEHEFENWSSFLRSIIKQTRIRKMHWRESLGQSSRINVLYDAVLVFGYSFSVEIYL